MIVLDTSLLVAWMNEEDVHHDAAASFMARFLAGEWEEGLLLEYVFLELVTVLQMRVGHPSAVSAGDILLRARELLFVPASDLFLPTLETFRSQGDRGLNFADAAVLTVARQSADGRIGTFDEAFRGIDRITVLP